MSAILENLLSGFDFVEKPDLAFGVLQYVVLEVLVSRVFRYFLKQPKSWGDDFFIHLISIPFLGGLSAWSGEMQAFDEDFMPLLLDGAKGIPAVFAAQYVVQSFELGPSLPVFTLKDVLITAASKAITRPIAGFLFQKVMPESIQEQWRDVDTYITKQTERSSIKGEPN